MSLNHGVLIVRDNLRIFYDPANSKCYSGTGNNITDLSNSGADATMASATSFSPDNGGVFLHAAAGANFSTNAVQNISANQITAMTWVKVDSHGNFHNFINNNWVNSGWLIFTTTTDWRAGIAQGGTQHTTGVAHNNSLNWTHLALTYNAVTVSFYVNGILASTNSNAPAAILNTGFAINFGGGTRPSTYKTALPMVYDRGLTAEEIRQNFQAHRGRFNI